MKRVYTSRAMHAKLLCDLLQSEGIAARFGWDAADSDDASVWIVEDSDLERALRFVEEFSRPSSVEQPVARWQCPVCGETVEEQFDSCWKCSAPDADPEDDTSFEESEQASAETNVRTLERIDPSWVLVRLLGALGLFLGFLGISEWFTRDPFLFSIVLAYVVAASISLWALRSRWGWLYCAAGGGGYFVAHYVACRNSSGEYACFECMFLGALLAPPAMILILSGALIAAKRIISHVWQWLEEG